MKLNFLYIIFLFNIFFSNSIYLNELYKKLNIEKTLIKEDIIKESSNLISIGKNHLGKEILLSQECAKAWLKMQLDAKRDSVNMFILSGFRSYQKQYSIIQNKLNQDRKLEEILKENKLPGLSSHHSGNAIDIISNGYKLSVDFANSDAYKWLTNNANKYGFYLQYPKDNKENIMFEPWHWVYKE